MSALIDWLDASPLFPKFFWKSKGSSTAFAALGKREERLNVPHCPIEKMFGCLFFPSNKRTELWNGFHSPYFFTPAELREGAVDIDSSLFESPTFTARSDSSTFEEWETLVLQTLERIHNHTLAKAVLARRTTLTLEAANLGSPLLKGLLGVSRNATVFAFQPDADALFFGATPELLYKREHSQLTTEAIAGTRPLEISDEDLLTSEKDVREFEIVKQGIVSALDPFVRSMHWQAEDAILKTTRVKHLCNTLSAHLSRGTTDSELLAALHPTPAMGGMPREEALAWIDAIEPFERGLYAAPIGWIGQNSAEFAVGIRSCLLRGRQLHLFAGAGIIAGSDPKREWEELDAKISPLLHLVRPSELCPSHR